MTKVKYACRVADIVIAICEQTKKDLIEILHVPEEKIRVAYQSCNSIYFNTIQSEQINQIKKKYDLNNDYFLFVGAFEEKKYSHLNRSLSSLW